MAIMSLRAQRGNPICPWTKRLLRRASSQGHTALRGESLNRHNESEN